MEVSKPILLPVSDRRFVRDISLPALANMRLYDPARKLRGLKRLNRKFAQCADEFFHGWLGVPARGRMNISAGDGISRWVEFDAHQSAFLAFVSRELHGGYETLETMFLDAVLPKAAVF